MLDGLELADGLAELDAFLGVAHRHFLGRLGHARLLAGQGGHGHQPGMIDRAGRRPLGAEQPGRRAGEVQPGQLPGLVEGRQQGAGQAGRVGADREHAEPAGRAGGHDDQVGGVAVDDVAGGAGYGPGPVIARRPGRGGRALVVPVPPGVRERHGGDRGSLGDPREQFLGGRRVTGGEDGRRREHGGQQRGAQQAAACFLQHDGEFTEGVTGAAVLLGHGQARRAELFVQLRPDGGIVTRVGGHEAAHFVLGRFIGQEGPDGLPERYLLRAERERHEISRADAALRSAARL